MDEKMVVETLEKLGGKLWEKGAMRRIYFSADQVLDHAGLTVQRYNTGNVCGAQLNGESISNSEAKRIAAAYDGFKMYYDLTDGKFARSGNPAYGYNNYSGYSQDYQTYLRAAITEQPVIEATL